jgi:glycosyltransferase involved in cell wall biosynthesis
MVNHEHWGVVKSRSELIGGFKQVLNVDFDETVLAEISSIEFLNSICVVRKKENADNVLGLRVVAGVNAEVMPVILCLANSNSAPIPQVENQWSSLVKAPAENYQLLLHEINMGKELLNKQSAVVEQLRNDVEVTQAEVAKLRNEVEVKQAEVAHIEHRVSVIQNSRSWRYTAALRKGGSLLRPIVKLLRHIKVSARNNGGYAGLVIKTFTLFSKEGWRGIGLRLSGIQSKGLNAMQQVQETDINEYQAWIKLHDTLDEQAITRIQDEIANFKWCPIISVIMPVYNAPINFLTEAVESVKAQLYPHWELCVADDASTDINIRETLYVLAKSDSRIKVVLREENGHISTASNSALELASGDYLALLDNDDLLTKDALFQIAKKIIENPRLELIYSDEDKIDENGIRCEPFFKPDWSPQLIISQAYLGHLLVFKKIKSVRFESVYDGAQDYRLCLTRAFELRPDQIGHVAKILYHWRKHSNSTASNSECKDYADNAGFLAVQNFIKNKYPDLNLTVKPGDYKFTYRVKCELSKGIKFSIIIPTKDKTDLLIPCITSILENTKWCNYEIIIINNNSVEPDTYDFFERLRQDYRNIRIIDAHIDFNWSRLNNIGVENASGDIFVFLNNDTYVISPEWLEILSTYAMMHDVGVVGAQLLFDDHTIQHNGVVVGLGGWADHLYRTLKNEHTGKYGFVSPALTRNVLAVTGACMVIEKKKLLKIGPFDEEFQICGSDVEICIRAYKLGYFNVVATDAKLIHYESKTRTPHVPENDFKQSAIKYEPYRTVEIDPFYNKNFDLKFTTPTKNL